MRRALALTVLVLVGDLPAARAEPLRTRLAAFRPVADMKFAARRPFHLDADGTRRAATTIWATYAAYAGRQAARDVLWDGPEGNRIEAAETARDLLVKGLTAPLLAAGFAAASAYTHDERERRAAALSALTMMIVKTKKRAVVHCSEARIGIPDAELCHDSGMITKRDARILTLSRLGCAKNQVLWDIGAGSGSISIEAARLYPGIEVYAIERNRERFTQLEKNIKKFRTTGVHAIIGSAPAALKKLPCPHSVFFGGSGGNLPEILQEVKKRIRKNGNLVVNCITITTLSQVLQILKKWQWNYMAASVQIAHLSTGDQPVIFRAENPLFIVHGTEA